MEKVCLRNRGCERAGQPFLDISGFRIYHCQHCGLKYTGIQDGPAHVDAVYGDNYFLHAANAGYPGYLKQQHLVTGYGRYYGNLMQTYMPAGSMLDVGAAAGFLMDGFRHCGWQVEGIEPNASMAAFGRERLRLNIHTGNFEQFRSAHRFQLISMVQVIGHFYDLDQAMENMTQLLMPRGFLLVESWNMDSFYARQMGAKWHEYSPPSVINWFSPETLDKMVSLYGLTPVARGIPPKRINLEHAFSLIPGLRRFQHIGKNMNLPYPFRDLGWHLYQRSE